jgi:hypothetical protein
LRVQGSLCRGILREPVIRVGSLLVLEVRVRESAKLVLMVAALLCAACGDDGSAQGGEPGPIIDNLLWEITADGEELFGAPSSAELCPPPGSECPVPEGDCVQIGDYPLCRPTYIAECLSGFTVMSVYTEQCDWVTLEQPLQRDIEAGDLVETRTFHFALNAGAEAHMALVIGDWFAFDERLLIPRDSGAVDQVRVAPRDFPAGTQVLFHVDNHGSNEYLLIEANLCDPSVCVPDPT